MVSDYRNRPPVDAPRPTVRSVLTSLPFIYFVGTVGMWLALAGLFAIVAVVLGWRW